MKLSEIAEYIVKKYPDCCMVENHTVTNGCREDWYEEHLIDPLMDFFSYEIIDMCGCGSPEDTLEMIRRLLHIRNNWHDGDNSKKSWEQKNEQYNIQLHINYEDEMNYGLLQFVMYMLDKCGILEHGSSIGGCWLTELGKMYLEVLDKWSEQENK